jgi:hypothetical protein
MVIEVTHPIVEEKITDLSFVIRITSPDLNWFTGLSVLLCLANWEEAHVFLDVQISLV